MPIIGIDLGTSNSAAAVLRGGRPVMIPSAEGITLGGKAFPSYVAVTADGQMLVGEPARRQAAANPDGTASAFKRQMGQREKTQLRDRSFSPEELSASLLQKIKRDAEAFLGEPVKQAVVTVPAYFNDNQRNATKDACRIAELEAARLINEPTAASLAYGLDKAGEELRIAVVDFGGGTLDVTIMEFGGGVFEVKATSGDTQLGGTDMDRLVFDHLAGQFRGETGIDVQQDPMAAARLREAAEMAKIELSASTTTRVSLPFLAAREGKTFNLDVEFSRSELERLVRPVIERCRGPVVQALHDAAMEPKDVDRLVFVGGPPGDLFVIVRTAPDPRFERRGADLWRSETVEVADAALGTKLVAPTLDGQVTAKVPAGTQPGTVLRLRGKGLPQFGGGRRGDLFLHIQIHVPEKITSKERALYDQLRALKSGPTGGGA